MTDVTQILREIEAGDPAAAEQLLPLVYEELRALAASKMAQERGDHTLQATALVHEAYVRLVEVDKVQRWESRGHFFTAAAEAMRRILIDAAREKQSHKRGGKQKRRALGDVAAVATMSADALIDFNTALDALASEDPDAAELVKLWAFAGLSVTQAGQVLGLSRATAYRTWAYARSWFAVHMDAEQS